MLSDHGVDFAVVLMTATTFIVVTVATCVTSVSNDDYVRRTYIMRRHTSNMFHQDVNLNTHLDKYFQRKFKGNVEKELRPNVALLKFVKNFDQWELLINQFDNLILLKQSLQ